MKSQPASYYDQLYESSTVYRCKGRDSVYRPLWDQVIRVVGQGRSITDLGCGPGQFAQYVISMGLTYLFGLDFSPTAIEQAKLRNPNHAVRFICGDLTDVGRYAKAMRRSDALVLLEVLEHVEDDLGILSLLPNKKKLVLSVPSYDSKSHVRFFPTLSSAIARYEAAMTVQTAARIPLENGSAIWMLTGFKT